MRRLKTIVKITSALLYILSLLLLIPLVVAWLYKEPTIVYKSFVYTSVLSFITATIFRFFSHNHKAQIDLTTAMILCTVSWVLASLIGSIPFMIGLNKSFIDAMFEAVSGFTTTGITVFEGLDVMSHGLIFWRSFIQWLGGLGILTFFLFVTTKSESDSWQLFSAEGHKINSARPVPNVYRTIKYFWAIYAAYTFIQILILWGLGMNSFDAIIHSMTTLSTGGFSNHDASIAYYQLAGY
ncbi:MAG: potassium transporter TrkG, partial [Halanaerobiales bacterium]